MFTYLRKLFGGLRGGSAQARRRPGARPQLVALEDRLVPTLHFLTGITLYSPFAVTGTTLNVTGTAGNDTFTFAPKGSKYQVTMDGLAYTVDPAHIHSITFAGAGGGDLAILHTGTGPNSAVLLPTKGTLIGANYKVSLQNVALIDVLDANGAGDTASLVGSAGNGFSGSKTECGLAGSHYWNVVGGFGNVIAYGGGGGQATLSTSTGKDSFTGSPTDSTLAGTNYQIDAQNFAKVEADASGSARPTATLHGANGGDTFVGAANQSQLSGSGYSITVNNFPSVVASENGGANSASLSSVANIGSTFAARPTGGHLFNDAYNKGAGFDVRANGFSKLTAQAKSFADVADLFGGAGDDTFIGTPGDSSLTGSGYAIDAQGFGQVHAEGGPGGTDTAYFYGTTANDNFGAYPGWARLTSAGSTLEGLGFDLVYAYAGVAGTGSAALTATMDGMIFGGFPTGSVLADNSTNNFISVNGFYHVQVEAAPGTGDSATLNDLAGGAHFTGSPGFASLAGSGYNDVVVGFASVTVQGLGGAGDVASLTDTGGKALFYGSGNEASLSGPGYAMHVYDFADVTVTSTTGYNTWNVGYVNYVLHKQGTWHSPFELPPPQM